MGRFTTAGSQNIGRRRPISVAHEDLDDLGDAQARLISLINALHERIQGIDEDVRTLPVDNGKYPSVSSYS